MRVLTDLSGPFDTVVTETVTGGMDEYIRLLQERFFEADMAKLLSPLGNLVRSGWRDYFTIESDS